MSMKAFGIAVKLTLRGENQFTHPSTYAFAIVTVVAILTQMNYFNKALNEFTPSMYDLATALDMFSPNLCTESMLCTMSCSPQPS